MRFSLTGPRGGSKPVRCYFIHSWALASRELYFYQDDLGELDRLNLRKNLKRSHSGRVGRDHMLLNPCGEASLPSNQRCQTTRLAKREAAEAPRGNWKPANTE